MKRLLLVLVSSILFCGGICGQCPQGNITLTTQQEVNNFAINYPGCTELLGDIMILGNNGSSITSLSSKSN